MPKPKKSLGQNFLINDKIIPEIITAAQINKSDTILEIGPGLGILTQGLVDTGAKIFAVEKDYELITKLKNTYKNTKNLTLAHQDALFFDPLNLKKYKIVANLPFNVASPIIRKFLENPNPPETMVIMIQKEVAEKILAKPGESNRGILTLAVEFYAHAQMVTEVSKLNFRPVPKVDAAIIKLKIKSKRSQPDIESKLFFRVVKAGFSSKRRQIHNSLAAALNLEKDKILEILKKSKIDFELRAEDLSLDQWLNLTKIIKDTIQND